MKKVICKPLLKLFEDQTNCLFQYDTKKNLIFVEEKDKQNQQSHEVLFQELQTITNELNELSCNYSVDENGNIILNCSDDEYECKIKCLL